MTRILSLIPILFLVFSGSASAQEWLSDRRYSEGAGVNLGSNLVLHPGIGIEAGYDSNVFYSSNEDEGEVLSAGRLRVTPHLDLSTRPPQRLENSTGAAAVPNTTFRLGLSATYQEYLSSVEAVSDQRNVEVDAGLRAEFLRRQAFQFFLGDTFARTTEPGNDAFIANFNRINNRADLGMRLAPGGRTLEFGLGYGFFINLYEAERLRAAGNFLGHDLYTTARWKFFPKTALIFDGHVTPTSYLEADSEHPSSIPVRVRFGLNGLLTTRLGIMALVGYGAGFYSSGDDFDSIIAQAEISYAISPFARFKLGYQRDFFDSIFSNFYVQDRGYLEYNHLIGGRFLLGIRGGVALLSYATLLGDTADAASDVDRRDLRADATVFGEYRLKDWLGINVSAEYLGNFTDWNFEASSGVDHGDFNKLQVFGGVRVFY